MTTTRRSVATLVASLLLLLSVVGAQQDQQVGSVRRRVRTSSGSSQEQATSSTAAVSLVPDDLPGYTGWARGTTSEAEHYRIVGAPSHSKPIPTNRMVKFQIACDSQEHCSNAKRARFYARMYGPAVLAGHVTSMGSTGAYEITFFPQDSGTYFVEVVLTFSDTPDFAEFPHVKDHEKSLGYEGHLLPSFPLQIEVEDAHEGAKQVAQDQGSLPICSARDLTLTDMMDGLTVGRWKVTGKDSRNGQQQQEIEDFLAPSIVKSITMDFEPRASCSLVPISSTTPNDVHHLQQLDTCLYNHVAGTSKPLRLIMVGDPIMALQYQQFLELGIPGITITYISASGGLGASYENVTKTMKELVSSDEERMVIFNSGLHDIMLLFNQMHDNSGLSDATQATTSESFYRTFHYRQELQKWMDFMATYPASQTIFQLTTAAWPKWGNWGISWPQHEEQPYLPSTHWAEQYNRIAMHVIQQENNDANQGHAIEVMDAYWMSLARPDHREISEKGREAKLVHPGPEVITALVRTYLTLVVSQLGCMA